MKNFGTVRLPVRLNNVQVEHEFWVCDSMEDGILGIPFMEENNAVLDIGRRKVFVGNKAVKIHDRQGNPMCHRIVASKTVYVPPGEEMIIPGRIRGDRKSIPDLAIMKPTKLTAEFSGAMVARTCVLTDFSIVPV